MAAAASASVLYYIGIAARPERLRGGWSTLAPGGVAVVAVVAILVGLYGALLAAPSGTKLWSRVATVMSVLALAGFAVGQVSGWWHGA
jgi:4-amino-4-deoxy-L-arabinose transferase-like glycosyltransferase